jgi:hypothetical protein
MDIVALASESLLLQLLDKMYIVSWIYMWVQFPLISPKLTVF